MHKERPSRRADLARRENEDRHPDSRQPAASFSNRSQPATASAREQVVLEFQRSMLAMTNTFIEAQREVMIAYLRPSEEMDPDRPGSEYRMADYVVPDVPYPAEEEAWQDTPDVSMPEPEPLPWSREAATESDSDEPELHTASQQAPAAPSQPAVEPAIEEAGEISAEALIASLLEIVSDRTGYPQEMLDPSLDMEADLGIDSIKRVEIFTSLRKLLPRAQQERLEGSIEQVIGIKNLQGIMDWIRQEFSQPALSGAEQSELPEQSNGSKHGRPDLQEDEYVRPVT